MEFSLDPLVFARIPGRRIPAKISADNKAADTVADKKMAETKFRPSLNREASRLGDVRVRRPSFRAQVPETYIGAPRQQKLAASKRMLKMDHAERNHHPELLLARLQKLQRSDGDDFSGSNLDCLQSQVSRVSATLRNRKSRKTLIRLEERSSSGYTK